MSVRVVGSSTPNLRLSLVTLAAVFLELPVAVVEGADLAGFEPPRDAVEVECVLYQTSISQHQTSLVEKDDEHSKEHGRPYIANTPGDGTFLACSRGLVGLALDTCKRDC